MIKQFLTRQAVGYITRNIKQQDGDALHIINETERKALKKVRITAYLLAAVAGAFFVLALYLPVYLWPDSWLTREDHFDMWGYYEFDFKLNFFLYSFLLLPPEIWAIRLINLWATARICDTFGFTGVGENKELEDVASLALERKDKRLKKYGINPYVGVPISYIIIVNLWVNFRQTLSNMGFKTLVRWGLGAESSSVMIDFSGIPVFATWNSLTTNTAIKNVILRMMSRSIIREMAARVTLEDEKMQRLTFLSIYYTSNIKRSYHPNHVVMLAELLGNTTTGEQMEMWAASYSPEKLVHEMKNLSHGEREWLEKVIVMGIICDGSISKREKKHLDYLLAQGVLTLQGDEVAKWCKDFKEGRFDVPAFLKSINQQ
jgi:hypothetical protein